MSNQAIIEQPKNCKAIMPISRAHSSFERETENNGQFLDDISTLINQIPKSIISGLDIDYKGKLLMGKYLLNFLENKYSKELISLKYSKHNSIEDLLNDFFSIIFNDGGMIKTIPGENDFIQVIYPQYNITPYLYIVDTNNLLLMESTPLKIGYAHLLQKLSHGCFSTFINKKSINCIEETHLYFSSDFFNSDDNDKETVDNYKLQEKTYLKRVNKILKAYQKYLNMPLEGFYNYNPRKQTNKELKEIISSGLSIDFEVVGNFFHPYEEDGSNYGDCFYMAFDANSHLEGFGVYHVMEFSNNVGMEHPSFCYEIDKNSINQIASPDNLIHLNEALDVLEHLSDIKL